MSPGKPTYFARRLTIATSRKIILVGPRGLWRRDLDMAVAGDDVKRGARVTCGVTAGGTR